MKKLYQIIKEELSWIKVLVATVIAIVSFTAGIFFEQHQLRTDVNYIKDKTQLLWDWARRSGN